MKLSPIRKKWLYVSVKLFAANTRFQVTVSLQCAPQFPVPDLIVPSIRDTSPGPKFFKPHDSP
jgi:hypothetical protein